MTEHESEAPPSDGADGRRPSRRWTVPSRIRGARTSTVAIGVCFVLTALLYGQVRPETGATTTEPQPSTQVEQPAPAVPSGDSSPSTESTTQSVPSSTESAAPPSTPAETGSQSSSTAVTTTPRAPTILPGVPVPPQLLSVLPSTPSATETR